MAIIKRLDGIVRCLIDNGADPNRRMTTGPYNRVNAKDIIEPVSRSDKQNHLREALKEMGKLPAVKIEDMLYRAGTRSSQNTCCILM